MVVKKRVKKGKKVKPKPDVGVLDAADRALADIDILLDKLSHALDCSYRVGGECQCTRSRLLVAQEELRTAGNKAEAESETQEPVLFRIDLLEDDGTQGHVMAMAMSPRQAAGITRDFHDPDGKSSGRLWISRMMPPEAGECGVVGQPACPETATTGIAAN